MPHVAMDVNDFTLKKLGFISLQIMGAGGEGGEGREPK